MKKVFARSTPTQLISSKYNLHSFEQRVNLNLSVLVNRCLTNHVSLLLNALFINRSLGSRSRELTRGQSSAALVLPRTFSRYGYHYVVFAGCRQIEGMLFRLNAAKPDFILNLLFSPSNT